MWVYGVYRENGKQFGTLIIMGQVKSPVSVSHNLTIENLVN